MQPSSGLLKLHHQQLQHVTPPAASLPPPTGHTPSNTSHTTPQQTAGHFSWSSGGEMQMGVGGGAPPVHIDTGNRQSGNMHDEVEVMSTDSSSSSSTDSN